jgi:hypothetical protein
LEALDETWLGYRGEHDATTVRFCCFCCWGGAKYISINIDVIVAEVEPEGDAEVGGGGRRGRDPKDT